MQLTCLSVVIELDFHVQITIVLGIWLHLELDFHFFVLAYNGKILQKWVQNSTEKKIYLEVENGLFPVSVLVVGSSWKANSALCLAELAFEVEQESMYVFISRRR